MLGLPWSDRAVVVGALLVIKWGGCFMCWGAVDAWALVAVDTQRPVVAVPCCICR